MRVHIIMNIQNNENVDNDLMVDTGSVRTVILDGWGWPKLPDYDA